MPEDPPLVASSGRPLRIALATHSFAPNTGGLEKLVAELANALADRGHSVTVLAQSSPSQGAPSVEQLANGVVIRRFSRWIGGHRFGYAPALTWWTRHHHDEFDVLNPFNYHAPVGLGLAAGTSLPLVLTPTYHGGGHSLAARAVHVPYRWTVGALFRRAGAVVCSSESERSALVEQFPAAGHRATVVVLASATTRREVALPFPVTRPVVLSAGRLDAYKHVDVLIQAVALLAQPVDLVICGAGPAADSLATLVRELGIGDRVHLAGRVSDEDLARWQVTAQIVTSLSEHESYGLSLSEGAAAGGVVVASDIPPHREIVAQGNLDAEFVAVDSSATVVASALERGLARPRAEGLAGHVRTWGDVATEYEAVYFRLLAATAAARRVDGRATDERRAIDE